MKDRIILLFQEHGNIYKKERIKGTNADIYLFECSLDEFIDDKLFSKKGLDINFIVLHNSDTNNVIMFAMGLATKDTLGDDAYEIVNAANATIKYGKFVLDKDGDLNWEIAFDSLSVEIEDIREYIYCCVKGIKRIVELL